MSPVSGLGLNQRNQETGCPLGKGCEASITFTIRICIGASNRWLSFVGTPAAIQVFCGWWCVVLSGTLCWPGKNKHPHRRRANGNGDPAGSRGSLFSCYQAPTLGIIDSLIRFKPEHEMGAGHWDAPGLGTHLASQLKFFPVPPLEAPAPADAAPVPDRLI
ncbi:hypothetical protein VTK56DRAFT_7814 [Thermocarpiscus australiensis]